MSALPVTITVKSFVLFFCKFSPPKKKFARKKGIAQKRETCLLISFFYVMPLNLHDPASIFRSRTTVRLYLAQSRLRWYRFNGSLFYLLILFYQFIKSSLIKLCMPLFRCIASLYTIRAQMSNICLYYFKKNAENFSGYPQRKGRITGKE